MKTLPGKFSIPVIDNRPFALLYLLYGLSLAGYYYAIIAAKPTFYNFFSLQFALIKSWIYE